MKNANKMNSTSIKSLLSLKEKGSLCTLAEKAFAYIFIHDDNIFPNLHILVDYTIPSKENNDSQTRHFIPTKSKNSQFSTPVT